ncbi:DEAD/DEAH box helicase family protein [Streptomyces sp. NPDC002671]
MTSTQRSRSSGPSSGALARDERRILLVLATGTGKTMPALQLVARLSKSSSCASSLPSRTASSRRTVCAGFG